MGTTHANPYLREPVILDDCVKNRGVYNCPSAKMAVGPEFIYPFGEGLGYLQANEGPWGRGTGFCLDNAYPKGWGGQMTDTLMQQREPVPWDPGARQAAHKGFVQSVDRKSLAMGAKLVGMQDPVSWVVCGETGANCSLSLGLLTYRDIRAIE